MADFSAVGRIESDDSSPDWSTVSGRMNSFQDFPPSLKIPAEKLARAGLYFTGESDRVRCFSCLSTIENWNQGDNPLDRHQAVSPACMFLSCAHGRNRPGHAPGPSRTPGRDEDMEFRLRTGEVVDETLYPKIPHMRSEDERFATFAGWPSWSPVRPAALAQAGMFYVPESSRQPDRVQCFCCGGMLSGWEEGDDPWGEHARHYSNCFFILGHDVGNVASMEPRQGGSHISGSRETYEGRLESFQGREHPISPERLARAGFYSAGDGDRVLCFKCGGGLKDWQPDEDPWKEHAKHYPGCSFLQAEKGQAFINSVQLGGGSSSNGFSRHERTTDVMQSAIGQEAVKLGFDPAVVERMILEKIRQSGAGYSTVTDLIHDIDAAATFGNRADEEREAQNDDPIKKLEMLQREKCCKVCMDRDISVVFLPCGHLITCEKCSAQLSKCPMCNTTITQKIKTYS
ncbi:E3 ubiquitin-protein ligase XIAP [Trichomycterus rosablanca]|uniref:E3 ubiquitin-protein ligase XIAP n=1 Tax=Trichomycterus rosablanca TaxID=2290929 RepID=UPI002F35D276